MGCYVLFLRNFFETRAKNSRLVYAKINVKWPFGVIQGHVFWGQWKGDEGNPWAGLAMLGLQRAMILG